MKSYLIAAILTPLFFASCEQKSVTVNPPDENKETTIIKEAPSDQGENNRDRDNRRS